MDSLGYGLAGARRSAGSGLTQQANRNKATALEIMRRDARERRFAKDQATRPTEHGTGQAFQNDRHVRGLDAERGPVVPNDASGMPQVSRNSHTALPAGAYSERGPGQNQIAGERFPNGRSGASDFINDFNEIEQSYRRIRSSVETPSQAGDVDAVFSFMKMLDPQSVMREGEFASSENAAGVPSRIQLLYNSLLSGDRLTPEMRLGFAGHAGGLYSAAFEQARRFNDHQDERANRYRAVRDGSVRPEQAFEPVEAQAVAPDIIEDGYRFLGGDASDPSSWEKVDQ